VKNLAFDIWDAGHLTVLSHRAALFRQAGWTSFEAVWEATNQAAVAKGLRAERMTLQFSLPDPATGEARDFFIKRHQKSPWKEYFKSWSRLRWPILGARPEWQAIRDFHDCDLPTMTPVMLGEQGDRSFLITDALTGCQKLSDPRFGLAESPPLQSQSPISSDELAGQVAQLTRRMHQHGLHHQDYYLGHLMRQERDGQLFVIDLGRARRLRKLSRHWIVKDLAQLNYSAKLVHSAGRLRFLREYLGRPLQAADHSLIRAILTKTKSIARHSRKRGL